MAHDVDNGDVGLGSRYNEVVKVVRKYNKSSDSDSDSYNDYLEQKIARLKEADRKNKALIESLLGDNLKFDIMLETAEETKQRMDKENNMQNMQQEIDIARETMSKTAYEKYMNNLLENGKITSEQYYEASLKLQLNEYENITGIKIDESELNENTEQGYYEIVEKVSTAKVQNIDEFFELYSKLGYGVDQGVFKYCSGEYYNYMIENIREKYHMSYRDAKLFLDTIDSIGACSYAAVCNSIVDYFYNKPKEFEEVFGFPLLKEDSNGNVYLNQGELLADMFFTMNHTQNGGRLFESYNGKTIFTGLALDKEMDGISTQKFMSFPFAIDQYLRYKDGIESNKETILILNPDEIKNRLENGEQLILGFPNFINGSTEYVPVDNAKTPVITNGGHAVYITDITDEGVIVSTWGEKTFINYDNFRFGWRIESIKFEQGNEYLPCKEIDYDFPYYVEYEELMDFGRSGYIEKNDKGEYYKRINYLFGPTLEVISDEDGTVVENFENSETGIKQRTTYDNGKIITEYSNGKIKTEDINGVIVIKEADGTEKTYTNVDRMWAWVGNTVINYKDGTEVVEWESGSKRTTYIDGTQLHEDTNGNKKTIHKDGTEVIEWANGNSTTVYSDGTEIFKDIDGNKKTTQKDGTEVIEWVNGDSNTVYSDGTEIFKDTNGNKKTTQKDGTEIIEWADGNKTTTYADGSKRAEWTNGNIETFYTDGSRKVEWSSGDITIVKSDGTEIIEWADGNRTTTYADGTKTTEWKNRE